MWSDLFNFYLHILLKSIHFLGNTKLFGLALSLSDIFIAYFVFKQLINFVLNNWNKTPKFKKSYDKGVTNH